MRLQFARLEDPSSSSRSVYFSLLGAGSERASSCELKVSQKIEGQCLNSMNKRQGVVLYKEQKALSQGLLCRNVGLKSSFVIEVRKRPSCGQNFRDLINNDWLLNIRN